MATACPGNAFYAQLPSVTQEALNYFQSNFTEIKDIVSKVNPGIDSGEFEVGKLMLRFDSVEDRDEFITSQIPIDPNTSLPALWTGISGLNIDNTDVILYFDYSNETGLYYTNDRIRTMYKIILLDPRVAFGGPNFRYKLF